jgi:putative salt-induced outer membrane protein
MTLSRRTSHFTIALSTLATAAALAPGLGHAQLTAPPTLVSPRPTAGDPTLDLLDAKWKVSAGLGLAVTSGNSKSSTFNVTAEASRVTDNSKLNLTGRGLHAKAKDTNTGASNVTGLNWAVGAQYDRDYDPLHFVFGRYDHMADRPANISARDSTYLGLGRHLVRSPEHTFDVSGGLGYSQDKYINAVTVAGESRRNYGRMEAVVSEASTHKLTETTSLKQKLGVFPNLKDNGAYRALFESGVAVSINTRISLTTGLTYRFDSEPGVNAAGVALKKGDLLFVTGLSIKYD